MVKEETMKLIMAEYFERNKIKAVPISGAGPDFLEGGKAIEVKGSEADFGKAMNQYCDYLLTGKYKDLAIALPVDLLDSKGLASLSIICMIAWNTGYKRIDTYLVAERGDWYYLRKLDGSSILGEVLGRVSSNLEQKKEEPAKMAEIAKKELKQIDSALRAALVELVTEKPDMTLTKVSYVPAARTTGQ